MIVIVLLSNLCDIVGKMETAVIFSSQKENKKVTGNSRND